MRVPVASRLNNFRDLGGIPVEGGVIARGRVFRSDDVSTVPPEQAAELWERGIRTIIDLRSPEEADHTGRGPLGDYDIAYLRLPLLRGGAEPEEFLRHLREDSATPEIVGGYYASTFVVEAETIVAALRTIAAAQGGVVFHCAAGKDRTGIMAAGVLAALGADDDAIAQDYARSAAAVPRIMARVSASIGHLMGESDEYFRAVAEGSATVSPLLGADRDAMIAMLRRLREEHGGPAAVLAAAGFDDEDARSLRRIVQAHADARGGAR